MTDLQLATEKLLAGDVVAFPTETVYGLAGCINNSSALKKIFTVKERPFFDPLIVHVASQKQAKTCFKVWPELAQVLADKFWPGPLTLVMPKSELISDIITSGLESVGVRMPRHTLALKLIEAVGVPLAAPSANKFGKTSPTKAEHVKSEFKDEVFVLIDESLTASCEVGIESTVLLIKSDLEKNKYSLSVLRKGAVVKSEIDLVLKNKSFNYDWLDQVEKKESPGHMQHHYMPDIPFIVCKNPSLKMTELVDLLNEKLPALPDVIENVKIIKPRHKISKIEFLTLSLDASLAAREFYSKLRLASQRKPEVLVFIQTDRHNSEMWDSLFDRMYKAASLVVS